METLLIINGILAAFTIYFLKDFHSTFKDMVKTVSELKTQLSENAIKTADQQKNHESRLRILEELTNAKSA